MPPLVTALLTVAAVPALFVAYIVVMESVVSRLPRRAGVRLRPWLWLLPMLAFIAVFLIYPTISTIFRSFYGRSESQFVGVENYVSFFTSDASRNVFVSISGNWYSASWTLIFMRVVLPRTRPRR